MYEIKTIRSEGDNWYTIEISGPGNIEPIREWNPEGELYIRRKWRQWCQNENEQRKIDIKTLNRTKPKNKQARGTPTKRYRAMMTVAFKE